MSACTDENSRDKTKDPDSTLDFTVDWATGPRGGWLAQDETISSSVWIVPDGLTKTAEDHTTTTATVWLSGGTLGAWLEVVNRITTNQGRTEDQTLSIHIEEH